MSESPRITASKPPAADTGRSVSSSGKDTQTDNAPDSDKTESWKVKILDPSLVPSFLESATTLDENDEIMFSGVPWVLYTEDGEGEDSSKTAKTFGATFPDVSYLDIRRQQNLQWADERLQQGLQILAENSNAMKQALECYQQGLELVPNHVDLLVAKGALYANCGNYKASLSCFHHALEIDPTHKNAQQYTKQVEEASERLNQQHANTVVSKAVRAQHDASLERSILSQDTTTKTKVAASVYDSRYPILPEKEDAESTGDSKKRRKRRKKDKKKKRSKQSKKRKKHRRRYSSSSSSSSSVGSNVDLESDDGEQHASRRRRRRRHCSESEGEEPTHRSSRQNPMHGSAAETINVEQPAMSLVNYVPSPVLESAERAQRAGSIQRRRSHSNSPSNSISDATTVDSLTLTRTSRLRRLPRHDKSNDNGASFYLDSDDAKESDHQTTQENINERPLRRRKRSESPPLAEQKEKRASDDDGTVDSLQLQGNQRKRRQHGD
jgi:tetratricopeptide (TPR) repeat protein